MKDHLVMKNWTIINKITIILMYLMTAFMIESVFFIGLSTDNSLYMSTEILDLFAMFSLLIIAQAIQNDEKTLRHVTKESIWLFCLSFTVAIGLFGDYYAWLVQGIAKYRTINYIANFFYYIAGPWSIYRAWRYCIFQEEGEKVVCPEWLKKAQAVIFHLAIFLDVINIFTGIYFTVGADGVYQRTEGSFVINAFPNVIMTFFIILVILKSTISKRQKYSLLFFCLVPVIATIIQIFFFGVSVQFVIGVIGIILMYVNIYTRKNIELSQQEAKLTQFQLQSHFFYNSMISIRTLVRKSPDDAIKALDHFMGYLRGSVDIMDVNSLIPVSKELKFVEDYLAIENVRFGGKVRYSIVNEVEEDFMIPPITIQPFVENAVRYGIRQKPDGEGLIEINIFTQEKYRIVEIKDNGVGFDINEPKDDGRTHIGISNTTRRIRMILNGNIEANSAPGEGTCIRIKVPR